MSRLAIIITSIATFITWLLISLGAAVRLFGAGLACPDWPLCYGTLAPALTLPILLEVGHRYLASLLGLLIILIYLLCIYSDNLRNHRRLAGWVAYFSDCSRTHRRFNSAFKTQLFYSRCSLNTRKFTFFWFDLLIMCNAAISQNYT